MKKTRATSKRVPVMIAWHASTFTILSLNNSLVSSYFIKNTGSLNPIAVPRLSATTVSVSAITLSSAPNQVLANFAGMLTRKGYPIAHII